MDFFNSNEMPNNALPYFGYTIIRPLLLSKYSLNFLQRCFACSKQFNKKTVTTLISSHFSWLPKVTAPSKNVFQLATTNVFLISASINAVKVRLA